MMKARRQLSLLDLIGDDADRDRSADRAQVEDIDPWTGITAQVVAPGLEDSLLGSKKLDDMSFLLPNKLGGKDKIAAGSYIEEKFISRSGKIYGPYLYLRFRSGGKLRSHYLGRADKL